MPEKRTLDHFFQHQPQSPPSKKGRVSPQASSPAPAPVSNVSAPNSAPQHFHPHPSDSSLRSSSPGFQALGSSTAADATATPGLPGLTDPANFSIPSPLPPSSHASYPFPIPQLPTELLSALELSTPACGAGHERTDLPNLDLVSWEPFLDRAPARALFRFLRSNLPFYRVKYSIKRPGGGAGAVRKDLDIVTPRYTTVFGVDTTARFVEPDQARDKSIQHNSNGNMNGGSGNSNGDSNGNAPPPILVDAASGKPLPANAYPTCCPRPVPPCLDAIRRLVEAFTGAEYNFVLVNYYQGGTDSISWHSDDERFLGRHPTIASLSLGNTRDFLLRHKPLARDARKDNTTGIGGNRGTFGTAGGIAKNAASAGSKISAKVAPATEDAGAVSKEENGNGNGNGNGNSNDGGLTAEEEAVRAAHRTPLKFAMAGGDLLLMRGPTQSHWLHSVPKRSPRSAGAGHGGRINITFRRALARGGTENYYQYNVGRGPTYVWDSQTSEMKLRDQQETTSASAPASGPPTAATSAAVAAGGPGQEPITKTFSANRCAAGPVTTISTTTNTATADTATGTTANDNDNDNDDDDDDDDDKNSDSSNWTRRSTKYGITFERSWRAD